MYFLKLYSKKLLMNALFLFLEIWSFLFRKKNKKEEIKTVGILFLPILGIGDLIMLSPAIQKFSKIFPDAKISLVTWVPDFIKFDNIEVVSYKDFKKEKMEFDLIISPTLSLRHLKYIFSSKYWAGYFTKNKIQSNFGLKNFSYDLSNEHYLYRSVRLIKAFDESIGNEFEKNMEEKKVTYPEIDVNKPEYFDNEIGDEEYAVFGVFSKWEDRQWPLENFVKVAEEIIKKGYTKKIVLIGDSSEGNKKMAESFVKLFGLDKNLIINTAGRNSLSESSYLIKNCRVFVGLDSGPSHIAYNLSPKNLVLFVTVNPRLRLPLSSSNNKILCPCPKILSEKNLYNGLMSVPESVAKKYIKMISAKDVISKLDELFKE